MDIGGLKLDHPIVTAGLIAVPLLLGSIFLFVGMAIYNMRKVAASQRWISTTGRIIKSEILHKHTTGGNYKIPVITYEYEAAAQRFEGTRVAFGSQVRSSDIEAAQQKIARYPVGSTVEVFYDPDNPTQAVLNRSAPLTNLYCALAGLMLLILIMVVGVVLLNYNRFVVPTLPR